MTRSPAFLALHIYCPHRLLLDGAESRVTTQLQRRFDEELEELFRRRTHWIRSKVRKPTVGQPPRFARKHVNEAIRRLNNITEASLLREHAVQSLSDIYDDRRQWHVTRNKGWGPERKRKAFLKWYENRELSKNCVYVFWAGNNCRYIGRTLNGKNRPQAHFHKEWFRGVKRIDIYCSRTKRNVPKLECLATHRFKPKYSKIKPATRKWYSRCPICEAQRMIRQDVRSMFRFRK